MKIPRKHRAQGIYTQPPQVRARLDELLNANALYREIRAKLIEEFGFSFSITRLSAYRAARILEAQKPGRK